MKNLWKAFNNLVIHSLLLCVWVRKFNKFSADLKRQNIKKYITHRSNELYKKVFSSIIFANFLQYYLLQNFFAPGKKSTNLLSFKFILFKKTIFYHGVNLPYLKTLIPALEYKLIVFCCFEFRKTFDIHYRIWNIRNYIQLSNEKQ